MPVLGAVAYDAKVVPIWEGFATWFAERGLAFDYVLYGNYERLVDALLAGHVDVAWNSPLAWIEAERLAAKQGRRARAIAMRDTDRDLSSVVLVRADGPTDVRALRRVAVGASDSPQATLIPLQALREAGAEALDVVTHEIAVGKHGDHVGGERDAARALIEGRVDAACILDANELAFARDGTLPAGSVRALLRTERFDHCNFTVVDDGPADEAEFVALLLGMSFADPATRPLMEMEGLTAWLPGRTSGYDILNRAVDVDGFVARYLATR